MLYHAYILHMSSNATITYPFCVLHCRPTTEASRRTSKWSGVRKTTSKTISMTKWPTALMATCVQLNTSWVWLSTSSRWPTTKSHPSTHRSTSSPPSSSPLSSSPKPTHPSSWKHPSLMSSSSVPSPMPWLVASTPSWSRWAAS